MIAPMNRWPTMGWFVLGMTWLMIDSVGASPKFFDQTTAKTACSERVDLSIALEPVAGTMTSLASLKGRTTVVFFFASWAPPSLRQLDVLMTDLEPVVSGLEARIVAVTSETVVKAKAFVTARKIPWPVASVAASTLANLNIELLPEVWILNREGSRCHVFRGVTSAETLTKALKAIAR